MKTTETSP